MKPKQLIKTRIDFIMTVLLLLLMGYMITGQELHANIILGKFKRYYENFRYR